MRIKIRHLKGENNGKALLVTIQMNWTYMEFILADGSEKPRYENMKKRRVRIELALRIFKTKQIFTGERVHVV